METGKLWCPSNQILWIIFGIIHILYKNKKQKTKNKKQKTKNKKQKTKNKKQKTKN
jgi:phosphotransferase system  glucose/maltose/N-acetylglucosamine-specific IIC component